MSRLIRLALLALSFAVPAHAAETADLPSASGGTQRVWYEAPANPWAVAILFPGGDGNIGLRPDGGFRHGGNFLVRTRGQWLRHGLAVLIPDKPAAIDDFANGRISAGYAEDIARQVRFARAHSPAPIWLIGTSRGTNAVAAGAARLTHGEIAGVVFTSSMTRNANPRRATQTVFDAGLDNINVPALVVSHQDDGCAYTPAADAPRLRAALTRSPRSEIMLFRGGSAERSGPCEPFARHGYVGIENEVVDKIVSWMRGR